MSKWLVCVAMLLLLPVAWSQDRGQLPQDPAEIAGPADQGFSTPPMTDAQAQFQKRAIQQQNIDRQLALKRDTDKLLELASQLKQNVDSTGPNILSVDVIKKAQEIEKLAKSVKEKMKGD